MKRKIFKKIFFLINSISLYCYTYKIYFLRKEVFSFIWNLFKYDYNKRRANEIEKFMYQNFMKCVSYI